MLSPTLLRSITFPCVTCRMPRESSAELAKALAVRVSVLLDATKQDHHHRTDTGHITTNETFLQQTADLIRVIFNHTSTEFQHFYEVLLARRLLRNRYISLTKEKQVLTMLPAMDKTALMIRDIEQTEPSMDNFRRHLLGELYYTIYHYSMFSISYLLSSFLTFLTILVSRI